MDVARPAPQGSSYSIVSQAVLCSRSPRRSIAEHGIIKVMAPRFFIQGKLLHPTLAQPLDRPGWVYKEKVDGWRMIAYKSGKNVQLVSRRAGSIAGTI